MSSTERAVVGIVALVGGALALGGVGRRADAGSTPSPSPAPSKLKVLADKLAADIRKKGKSYDHDLCAEFQRAAGLDADGKYGLKTRDALFKAGIKNPPAALYGRAPQKPSDGPKGTVTLGPITEIITDDDGTEMRIEHAEQLTPAEQAAWAMSHPGEDWLPSLLTPAQKEAQEDAAYEQERAARPAAPLSQMDRALQAALRAKELMGKRSVPPISAADDPDFVAAPITSIPLVSAPRTGKPSPINLELARREAPAVAAHIEKKKRNYSRQMLKDFQRHAGLNPDGVYGPVSESALRYFGIVNPPTYLYEPAKQDAVRVYYAPTQ